MNFNIIRIFGLVSLTSLIYAGPTSCAFCLASATASCALSG